MTSRIAGVILELLRTHPYDTFCATYISNLTGIGIHSIRKWLKWLVSTNQIHFTRTVRQQKLYQYHVKDDTSAQVTVQGT